MIRAFYVQDFVSSGIFYDVHEFMNSDRAIAVCYDMIKTKWYFWLVFAFVFCWCFFWFFLILTVNGCNWGYGIVWLPGIDTGRCCNRYNNIVRYLVWFVDIIRTIRTRLWTLGIWVLFVNEQLAYSSWPISWSKPIICLWQRDKCIFHKRAALISCF